jgi:hypothetical protein
MIRALEVQGSSLYAGVDSDMTIMDLATPSAPSVVGSVSIGGVIDSLTVDGQNAYAVDAAGRLTVVDVSNPGSPSVTSTVPLSATGTVELQVHGDYLYVLDSDFGGERGDSGLRIVDVSSPVSPTVVDVETWSDRSVSDADSDGEFIAVGLSSNSKTGNLDILEVGQPATSGTVLTSTYVVGADVGGVEWISSTVLVNAFGLSSGVSYLDVIDMSDSSEPILVGRYEYPDTSVVFSISTT